MVPDHEREMRGELFAPERSYFLSPNAPLSAPFRTSIRHGQQDVPALELPGCRAVQHKTTGLLPPLRERHRKLNMIQLYEVHISCRQHTRMELERREGETRRGASTPISRKGIAKALRWDRARYSGSRWYGAWRRLRCWFQQFWLPRALPSMYPARNPVQRIRLQRHPRSRARRAPRSGP